MPPLNSSSKKSDEELARKIASPAPSEELTRLLQAWASGDEGAMDRVVPLVYQDLRRIAHRHMRGERVSHTLQTTALVHEAILRLEEGPDVDFEDRRHFFATCAKLMRHVLIDLARSRQAIKRGRHVVKVPLDETLHRPETGSEMSWAELLAIDEALQELQASHQRAAKVVELRFFGGFSVDETARALDVSPETVMRDWKLARARLARTLASQDRTSS